MGSSSILGGDRVAPRPEGRDVDRLGPSDSSDSGSDVQGERAMPTGPDNAGEIGAVPSPRDSTSDATGTGERTGAFADGAQEGADILPDRVIEGSGDADEEIEALAGDLGDAAEGGDEGEDDEDEDEDEDGGDADAAAD